MLGISKDGEHYDASRPDDHGPWDIQCEPSISLNQLEFYYEKSVRNAPETATTVEGVERRDGRKRPHTFPLREADERKLVSRQKQIDYGKNTIGYQRYISLVPRRQRKPEDPHTPNKYQVCSKRSWDGQVTKWRRMLHKFDPEE